MSTNPKTQGVISPLLLIYFADEPSTGSHLRSEHVSDSRAHLKHKWVQTEVDNLIFSLCPVQIHI